MELRCLLKLLLRLVMFVITVSGCNSGPGQGPALNYPAPHPTNKFVVTAATTASNGSLFAEDGELFADTRAHKAGDILMVIISEINSIEQDDDVDLSKESELEAKFDPSALGELANYVPMLANKLTSVKGSRKSNHRGQAKYEKKSVISDRLAVIVKEVRSDGLLTVWGRRQIKLDGEYKTVTLTGLVNPHDILPDNSIRSERVALAAIHFQGRGTLTSTTEPGLAAKSFRWVLDVLWPF